MGIEFGKTRTSNFEGLRNMIAQKAMSLQGKLLNQEGRGVLIKAILQAIPTYNMSYFKIPKKILDDISRITANF